MRLDNGDFDPLAAPLGLVAASIRDITVISPKDLGLGGTSTEKSLGLCSLSAKYNSRKSESITKSLLCATNRSSNVSSKTLLKKSSSSCVYMYFFFLYQN